LLSVCALLVAAAPAAATTRYAAPAPLGTADCLSAANACALSTAVASSSGTDDVSLVGGISPAAPFVVTAAIAVNGGISVHGEPGLRPTIQSSAANPIFALGGGTLRDMILTFTGANASPITLTNGTLDRVSSNVTGGAGSTCGAVSIQGPATIRNSTFWNNPDPSTTQCSALDVVGTSSFTVNLQNVTAVSAVDAPGIRISPINGTVNTVNASNTIAMGGPASVDIFGQSVGSPGVITGNFDHSNYDTATPLFTGVQITQPGTGTGNVTAPPVFVDAVNGDLRQTAASAGTIDLGTATGIGTFDVFGSPRLQGTLPDIGADEIGPSTPPGINTPIAAGATHVAGVTSEANGTVIEVFVNGVSAGTGAAASGAWSVTVPPLSAGDQVRATARAPDEQTSAQSGFVPVQSVTSLPVFDTPVGQGATSVSGHFAGSEPDGTLVHVFVNGNSAGTATAAGGVWSLPVAALAAGDALTADAAAPGKISGDASAPVTVQAYSQVPTVTAPIFAGSTSVSGTSPEGPGSSVQVFVNGVPTGAPALLGAGSSWTAGALPALTAGSVVTAIAQGVGELPSAQSPPVTVQPEPVANGRLPQPRCGKKKKLKRVKGRFRCVKKKRPKK
jgi:hypothetical protein